MKETVLLRHFKAVKFAARWKVWYTKKFQVEISFENTFGWVFLYKIGF